MKSPLILVAVFLVSIICARAVQYHTVPMNFPPSDSREISSYVDTLGDLTITIPSSLNLTGYTSGGTFSGGNLTYSGLSARVDYNMTSPVSCSEGTRYESKIYVNDTYLDSFHYICIPDDTITNFKIEYGHGDANYLSDDELYISPERITLFNLIRVWNIGAYLSPDEPAINATVTCYFDDYPVRTFGRNEVSFEGDNIKSVFHWDIIESGYWFRIGVLSQDVFGTSVGDTYNISCGNLNYTYEHETVVAHLGNLSMDVRSVYPFNVTFNPLPGDPTKVNLTISNVEQYPVFDVYFDRTLDGYQYTNRLLFLNPGDWASYRTDKSDSYNITIYFIPSWYRNSRNPVYYEQRYSDAVVDYPIISPPLPDVFMLLNSNNSGIILDDHVFDSTDLDSALNWSFTGNESFEVVIDNLTRRVTFIPNGGFVGSRNITFTVTDSEGNYANDTLEAFVIVGNAPPVINGTIPDQTRGPNQGPFTLNLTLFGSDVEDSKDELNWSIGGFSGSLFSATSDGKVITFSPLINFSGSEVVTITLSDTEGLIDSQDIFVGFNMSHRLNEGWNLFSIPPVQNNSIFNVLKSLGNGNWGKWHDYIGSPTNASSDYVGRFSIVWGHDDDSNFISFNPSLYYVVIDSQDLLTIEPFKGYWINMNNVSYLNLSYND